MILPGRFNENTIQVSELADYAGLGLEVVLFTNLSANFVEILDETFDDHEKAELLSVAARESLTEETFFTNQDGIFYLAAAQHFGVQTRLTDIYTHAILALASHANDLATARIVLARSKGILTR